MASSKERVYATSKSFGERNDCTVKALALTTNLTYAKAHRLIELRGRRKGHGAYQRIWMPAFEDAGYKLIRVQGITAKTVTRICDDPKIKKSYVYIVMVRGHVLPIRYKKVLDWTNGRRHRVLEVYRVAKVK